jgi:hypothetical protein
VNTKSLRVKYEISLQFEKFAVSVLLFELNPGVEL